MAIQHLGKLISSFNKDHPNKPIATSKAINTSLLMARLTVKFNTKRTQGWPTHNSNKRAKKTYAAFGFYCIFGIFLKCRQSTYQSP